MIEERLHIIPLNDLRPHAESSVCWCSPDIAGRSIWHKAMDGRVDNESGKWVAIEKKEDIDMSKIISEVQALFEDFAKAYAFDLTKSPGGGEYQYADKQSRAIWRGFLTGYLAAQQGGSVEWAKQAAEIDKGKEVERP